MVLYRVGCCSVWCLTGWGAAVCGALQGGVLQCVVPYRVGCCCVWCLTGWGAAVCGALQGGVLLCVVPYRVGCYAFCLIKCLKSFIYFTISLLSGLAVECVHFSSQIKLRPDTHGAISLAIPGFSFLFPP